VTAWVEQAIDIQSATSTDKYTTVRNRRYGETNGFIGTVPFVLLFAIVQLSRGTVYSFRCELQLSAHPRVRPCETKGFAVFGFGTSHAR
jgi:hypothetical protein